MISQARASRSALPQYSMQDGMQIPNLADVANPTQPMYGLPSTRLGFLGVPSLRRPLSCQVTCLGVSMSMARVSACSASPKNHSRSSSVGLVKYSRASLGSGLPAYSLAMRFQ